MPKSRAALLIEASKVPSERELPGAVVDVVNFRRFLESQIGGAWEKDEILELHNPVVSELRAALSTVKTRDYSFIAFSGHGEHLRGKELDESVVLLSDRIEVPVRELNSGSQRCTVVIDSCRGLRILDEQVGRSLIKLASGDNASRARHRELFDQQLDFSEAGAIYLYSCSVDESAQETVNGGGVFTASLIQAGEEFYNRPPVRSVLTVDTAFLSAFSLANSKYPQQHPQFQPGRRLRYFPFAVKA